MVDSFAPLTLSRKNSLRSITPLHIQFYSHRDGPRSMHTIEQLEREVSSLSLSADKTTWVDVQLPEDAEESFPILQKLRQIFNIDQVVFDDIISGRIFDTISERDLSVITLVEGMLDPVGMAVEALPIVLLLLGKFVLSIHSAPFCCLEHLERDLAQTDICCEHKVLALLITAIIDGYAPTVEDIAEEAESLGDMVLLLSSEEQAGLLQRFMNVRRVISRIKAVQCTYDRDIQLAVDAFDESCFIKD